MSAKAELPEVSIERIAEAMKEFSIDLTITEDAPAATANLNGFPVTFAALGSVVIVRTDSLSDIPTADGNATLYMVANQLNSIQMDGAVAIVDYGEHLIVRTEKEVFTAHGMTDEQLKTNLKDAVDAVLKLQDAAHTIVERGIEES